MSQKTTREEHYSGEPTLGAMELAPPSSWTKLQGSAVIGLGLAFCLGVIYHRGFLNGLSRLTHYEWPWQELGIWRTAALLFAPFAGIVWVLWTIEREKSTKLWWLLGLLAVFNFLLQTLGMLAGPRGIQLVREIVASPKATS